MQKIIVPNLWFDHNAKEAVEFYTSVFPESKITDTQYYPVDEGQLEDFQKEFAGKELVINFELNGNKFAAINAGPEFKFTEAVSFVVECDDQDEIDYFWSKLSSHPEFEQCGWCKDKYGLSWQIVPKNMGELMQRPDAFAHMSQMKKLVIADF